MYKLVHNGMFVLIVISIILGFTNQLPFSGISLIISSALLVTASIASNILFGKLYNVPVNLDSVFITAFILYFILPPATNTQDGLILIGSAVVAMLSKFVINYKGKHIFNPAAFAALILVISGISAATWWVGSEVLLFPVAIVGLLIVRKIHRFDMFLSFLLVAFLAITLTGMSFGSDFQEMAKLAFTSWPLIFFGTVMLTEPFTSPPTRGLRIMYGGLVGLLFGTVYHIGPVYNSPELALIIGNIFSYVVSSKERLRLTLKEKIQISPTVFDYVFTPNHAFTFKPGQYLEWTLPHKKPDYRGIRRYFTIASGPSEREIHLGVKIPQNPSTFKQALSNLKPGEELFAGQLSGDFYLPHTDKKIVAIAGGVGITPFRSWAKHIIDTNQKADITLYYASSDEHEFAYGGIFTDAEKNGFKTIHILSGAKNVPDSWKGRTGYITSEMIKSDCPDFLERTYYLSGPPVMVDTYKKLLQDMGISRTAIKTDYFAGY